MSLKVTDTVFTRAGKPLQVTHKNPKSGEINVERDLEEVQKDLKSGVVNGLNEKQKAAYREEKEKLLNKDVKERIHLLLDKFNTMKNDPKADKRLMRYIEGDLQHLMSRSGYYPSKFALDASEFGQYEGKRSWFES